MAKLKVLPSMDIISGFKGKIDFYVWNGIPCARRWPRSPGRRRAPAVERQWSAFTYAVHKWNDLTQVVKDAYKQMSQGTGLTSRDWFIRSYLAGIYRYPTGEPD